MALRSFVLQSNLTHLFPTFKCCLKQPSFQSRKMQKKVFELNLSRRLGLIATMASMALASERFFDMDIANGVEFRSMTFDQTMEEAQSGFKIHAKDLLQIKDLLESGSWKEAQKALRKSSSLLKKDFYTIIQSKPGTERPKLRKLYSDLFNNVSRLDYAARDKDRSQVWQRYENIVVAINDILSRI
ncbi:hypothetical protein L6164_033121 [Bauhinia variegata]|uniref:Uncharacterized protein n=1 Tax=Bauhinia variegata TaxID=167791 RepID=A0ACB9KQX3_BAUVA|nr:hypothetical protein L6164_033121 [Bauhinia variegata]